MKSWTGRWIYTQDGAPEKNTRTCFRREFTVGGGSAALKQTRLHITADTCFRLYINGDYVCEGPLRSKPFYKYYETVDITGFLREGANAIGAVVYYVGTDAGAPGGLLCQAEDADGSVLFHTDAAWEYLPAACWATDTHYFRMNAFYPYQEFYDARLALDAFSTAGYATAGQGWRGARILRGRTSDIPPAVDPFGLLMPRDIPPMETGILHPESVVETGEMLGLNNRMRGNDLSIVLSMPGQPLEYASLSHPQGLCGKDGRAAVFQSSTHHLTDGDFDGFYNPYAVLDFGKIYTGYIEFEVEAAEGQFLEVGYAERLINGAFVNSLEAQYADRYITKNGVQTYRFWAWRGFRYVKLLVRNAFNGVTVRDFRLLTTTYPYDTESSAFDSSDESMNRLFDICRHTVRLCSNEFFMDTPWREQCQWVGDTSAVTIPCVYACFNDTLLAKKYLYQSAASQFEIGLIDNITNVNKLGMAPIPDYTLWWIHSVYEYHRYTGDTEILHRLYPTIVKALFTFERYIDHDGLINHMPYWILIDWAGMDHRGKSAALNAMFYGVCLEILYMARLKNDAYIIDLLTGTTDRIKKAFVPAFFDEAIGCLKDASNGGVLSGKVSEQANAAALYFGLCDEETADRIIETLYVKESVKYTEAQPFFAAFAVKALLKYDKLGIAHDKIIGKWVRRMLDKGASSTYEEWGVNGSMRSGRFDGFMRSLSHSWSAYPAEYLLHGLAGFEILEAGCTKIRLAPRWPGFSFTSKFTIPQGEIRISMRDGQAEITAPAGVDVVCEDGGVKIAVGPSFMEEMKSL